MGLTRRDRIRNGLKCCLEHHRTGGKVVCEKCPFHGHQYPCIDELLTKALEYIDGKGVPHLPEVGIDFEQDGDAYYCGACGRRVFQNYKCCPGCGEEIDWCEVEME